MGQKLEMCWIQSTNVSRANIKRYNAINTYRKPPPTVYNEGGFLIVDIPVEQGAKKNSGMKMLVVLRDNKQRKWNLSCKYLQHGQTHSVGCINYVLLLLRQQKAYSRQSDAKLGTTSGWFTREVLVVFWNVVDNMFDCSVNLADIAKRQRRRQEVEYF